VVPAAINLCGGGGVSDKNVIASGISMLGGGMNLSRIDRIIDTNNIDRVFKNLGIVPDETYVQIAKLQNVGIGILELEIDQYRLGSMILAGSYELKAGAIRDATVRMNDCVKRSAQGYLIGSRIHPPIERWAYFTLCE